MTGHGDADHSGCRRHRHHGHHHRRLVQRQRRRGAQEGHQAGRHQGPEDNMVELSVSHYLLARGLSTVKLEEKDIKAVNTSDADIVAAAKSPETTAVVTWNPQLLEVQDKPGRLAGVQLQQDPGRDPGSARRRQRGPSRTTPISPRRWSGSGTNHRPDEDVRQGQGRTGGDGQVVGHRFRGLRDPAQDHRHVLHANAAARLHERPRTCR